MTKSATPGPCWSIPVRLDDVPAEGLSVSAVADPATCACVAQLAGVDAVLRLEANFDVVRRGQAGMSVMGTVSARVRQTCGLTLETLENEISEPVGVTFMPPGQAAGGEAGSETDEVVLSADDDEPPEPLVDGRADLGRLATEFLLLAVEKYPRKPGAEFRPTSVGDAGGSAFDALAALTKDRNPAS